MLLIVDKLKGHEDDDHDIKTKRKRKKVMDSCHILQKKAQRIAYTPVKRRIFHTMLFHSKNLKSLMNLQFPKVLPFMDVKGA